MEMEKRYAAAGASSIDVALGSDTLVSSALSPRSGWSVSTLSQSVGAFVGLFLQCSMLGIYSYFVTSKSTTIAVDGTTEEWSVQYDTSVMQRMDTLHPRLFALVWSILVSCIGMVILLTIRSLVVAVVQIPLERTDTNDPTRRVATNDALIQSVMRHATVGALVGVCVASALISLGVFEMVHVVTGHHSDVSTNGVWFFAREAGFLLLVVLGAWTVWTILVLVRSACQSRVSSDLAEPLLNKPVEPLPPLKRTMRRLQCSSLLFGSIVGWLIQCSSLSANFYVVYYHQIKLWQQQPSYSSHAAWSVMAQLQAPTTRHQIILTSLIWSFVASSMGIVLLFLIRALLMKVSQSHVGGPTGRHLHVLLHVECWFAVGTVLGLNLAWTITEYVLSVHETHWLQSIGIFLGTMAWCQCVLYCCGYRNRSMPVSETPIAIV